MDPVTVLHLAVGSIMLVFGIHQMLSPQYWFVYLPPWLKKLIPFSSDITMRIHSLGNITLGIMMILWVFPVITAWATLFWWLSILPFVLYYKWDVGLRDLTIFLAIVALLLML